MSLLPMNGLSTGIRPALPKLPGVGLKVPGLRDTLTRTLMRMRKKGMRVGAMPMASSSGKTKMMGSLLGGMKAKEFTGKGGF